MEKMTPEEVAALQVGDQFVDADGALCVYLGYEAEAEHQKVSGTLNMYMDKKFRVIVEIEYRRQRSYMCFYKNEWIPCEMTPETECYKLNDLAKQLKNKMSATYVEKNDWRCKD